MLVLEVAFEHFEHFIDKVDILGVIFQLIEGLASFDCYLIWVLSDPKQYIVGRWDLKLVAVPVPALMSCFIKDSLIQFRS